MKKYTKAGERSQLDAESSQLVMMATEDVLKVLTSHDPRTFSRYDPYDISLSFRPCSDYDYDPNKLEKERKNHAISRFCSAVFQYKRTWCSTIARAIRSRKGRRITNWAAMHSIESAESDSEAGGKSVHILSLNSLVDITSPALVLTEAIRPPTKTDTKTYQTDEKCMELGALNTALDFRPAYRDCNDVLIGVPKGSTCGTNDSKPKRRRMLSALLECVRNVSTKID